MDLNQYREEILETARLSASAELDFEKEEFLREMAEALEDIEEIIEFTACHHEVYGRKNKKIELDGYGFDNADDSLCLFYADYSYQNEIKTITQSEADKIFDKMLAFVEASEKGLYCDWEESSPGYGFAFDLYHKLKNNSIKKIRLYIITDKIMSDRIQKINADKYGQISVDFNIWDISRFYKVYESKGGKEKITINFKEFTEFGLPCLKASQNSLEEYDAYLSVIPGRVLADIYIKYGGKLLEGNVRAFLNTTGKVNTGIRNTIVNLPEMFFAYNNGIAGTALDVKTECNETGIYITELTDFQIVNGGQTTASIANAMQNPPPGHNQLSVKEKVNSIFVPLKLSIVSEEKAETLIPDIARYANSQNKVNDADFFANHPFHIEMERFSRRLLVPKQGGAQYSTKWYYERSRKQYDRDKIKGSATEQKKFALEYPKTQKIDKVTLAKYLNSYYKKPHVVSAGNQKNFMEFAKMISTNWINNRNAINEAFYRRSVCLAIMFKKIDSLVSKSDWYSGGYKANVVTYTMAKLFDLIDQQDQRTFNFQDVWARQDLSNATIIQLQSIARSVYEFIIKPSGVQNVTEWCKRVECWNGVKALQIGLNPEFTNELISKVEKIQEERNEISKQRLTNRLNKQIEVVTMGGQYWKDMFMWGDRNKLLTPMEKSLLLLAAEIDKGNVPSDRQAAKILDIRERLRKESYPE
jgi:hypothetical protein